MTAIGGLRAEQIRMLVRSEPTSFTRFSEARDRCIRRTRPCSNERPPPLASCASPHRPTRTSAGCWLPLVSNLADFLTFEVGADAERPDITNEGMQYEGMRFRAEGRLAGKPYGDPFGVDTAWQGCYPAGRWGERATSRLRLAYFALNVADTTAMSVQDTSRYGALG